MVTNHDFATESRLTFIRAHFAYESDQDRKRREQLAYLKKSGKWLANPNRVWKREPLLQLTQQGD